MFSTPTRRLLFLALTTLASAMWLAKDRLPLWSGMEQEKTTPPEGGAVVVSTGRDPTSCRSLSTYIPQRNVDTHTSMRCRKASE